MALGLQHLRCVPSTVDSTAVSSVEEALFHCRLVRRTTVVPWASWDQTVRGRPVDNPLRVEGNP
eukprot:582324-Pyramimonas_sp.AAC.1